MQSSNQSETVALAVVKNDVGKVLIVQRARAERGSDDSRLLWAFPGGKPDDDETLQEAVVRETKSETGYKIGRAHV